MHISNLQNASKYVIALSFINQNAQFALKSKTWDRNIILRNSDGRQASSSRETNFRYLFICRTWRTQFSQFSIMTPILLPFLFCLVLLPLSSRTSGLFSAPHSLEQAVHHWLHWGANSDSVPAAHPHADTSASTKRLPSWIVGAANFNGTAIHPLPYPYIMMHRPEADLVASYLRPSDTYLEFGSGGSTLAFARLVRVAYSIEHDCDWVRYVEAEARRDGAIGNLVVKCVQMKQGQRGWGTWSKMEHGSYEQFREYVDVVKELGVKFDRILIDGRARVGCALRVLPYLEEDGVVFLHDFYARVDLYKEVLKYYVEVARVLAYRNLDVEMGPIDEPQGLVVLRKREGIQVVREEEIRRVYEGDWWRKGFGKPVVGIGGWARYVWGLREMKRWSRARNVKMLMRNVRRDLVRLALVYGIVMFLVRNWGIVVERRKRGKEEGKERKVDVSEPKEVKKQELGQRRARMIAGKATNV